MDKKKGFWGSLFKENKTSLGVLLGSIFFVIYSCFAVKYEISQGWDGYPSIQNIVKDVSRFVPVMGAAVAFFIFFIDAIAFFISWKRDRIQEIVKKAYDKGYKDGEKNRGKTP